MSIPTARLIALRDQILRGHAARALPELERLHRRQPRNTTVLSLRGDALHRVGRSSEAIDAYRQAGALGAGAYSWMTAGLLLAAEHDLDQAVQCLRKALAEAPDDPGVLDAMICTLFYSARFRDGIEFARRLLTVGADPAVMSRAALLLERNDLHEEASEAFKEILRRAPDDPAVMGSALVPARYTCEWDWSESLQQRITAHYARGDFDSPQEFALTHIAWCADEALNLDVTRAYIRRMVSKVKHIAVEPLPSAGRRIRVGYLSSDFRNHATLHLMAGLFEHHDRSRFEVFAYDYSVDDGSDYRRRFLAAIEHHMPVHGLDDAQAAARIAQDRLDILFDLKLYTGHSRSTIVAQHPAPVTATYIGFPGSAATTDIDYTVADRFVTPDSSKPHYPEKLCRLPHTYQCNDRKRAAAPQAGSRAAHGLPAGKVVFGVFTQSYKIDRDSFRVWMRILQAVPDSVLWMLTQSQTTRENLARHARDAGVDSGRIIFTAFVGTEDHRARLPLADAVLDTLVYNGHTTTSDVLWAGVPVVTARGRHFASRVSESLLNAIGLPELVGADPDDMVRIASRIGTDAAYRQGLRRRVEANRLTAPLFDTARFTRDFETAIQMMVERHRQGLAPDHIDVPDQGPVQLPAQIPAQPRADRPQAARAGSEHWLPLVERTVDLLGGSNAPATGSRKPVWVDVGCGSGELMMAAGGCGFGSIGLGTDPEAVARLRQQGYKALVCKNLATDFLGLRFDTVVPDVVSLMGTLSDFPDPQAALRKAAQVLRPGGVLILSLPDSSIPALALPHFHGPGTAGSTLFNRSSTGMEIHVLRKAGTPS